MSDLPPSIPPGPAPRGNALVAAIAESLGFLLPLGPLPADAEVACARTVQVAWRGPDGTCGEVLVGLDRPLSQAVAANLLGRMPGEDVAESEIDETAKELANVISGNLLPGLYGTDHEFHLAPPALLPPGDPGGRREAVLRFVEGDLVVAVETAADHSRALRAVAGAPP